MQAAAIAEFEQQPRLLIRPPLRLRKAAHARSGETIATEAASNRTMSTLMFPSIAQHVQTKAATISPGNYLSAEGPLRQLRNSTFGLLTALI